MSKQTNALIAMRDYLIVQDNLLMANDGDCRDTLEGCEDALRTLWLMINNGLGIAVD